MNTPEIKMASVKSFSEFNLHDDDGLYLVSGGSVWLVRLELSDYVLVAPKNPQEQRSGFNPPDAQHYAALLAADRAEQAGVACDVRRWHNGQQGWFCVRRDNYEIYSDGQSGAAPVLKRGWLDPEFSFSDQPSNEVGDPDYAKFDDRPVSRAPVVTQQVELRAPARPRVKPKARSAERHYPWYVLLPAFTVLSLLLLLVFLRLLSP